MPFGIYALAVAAFAIGTAEFVISGILPPLAADLFVDIPTAGLLVTVYAIGVAIGGPIVAVLTARLSQKLVLVVLLLVFALAQLLCALAPDYGLLVAARLLSAVAHGTFFGAGNMVVARLAPPDRRGAAFSLFIGGITAANLLGLPGGTAIGVAFGWRATFLAVALIGLAAAIVVAWRVPPTPAAGRAGPAFSAQLAVLRQHQVWLSYVTIALVMTGSMAFMTYQVPIMLNVTRLTPEIVPLYLLVGGVGSIFGIWLGGTGTDWKPMPVLIAVLLLQSLLFFTMVLAMTDKVWMLVNLLAVSIAGFAFSTPLQSRVILAASAAPNLASALISTAFNVGIAAGAGVGALLLSMGVSYADLPGVGIVTSLLAAGTATLSWKLEMTEIRESA